MKSVCLQMSLSFIFGWVHILKHLLDRLTVTHSSQMVHLEQEWNFTLCATKALQASLRASLQGESISGTYIR